MSQAERPNERQTDADALGLSIVVVSYNVAQLLRVALRSVEANLAELELTGFEAEVFVVDNASSDGSADMVAVEFPWVRLIRSSENRGFSAGNNLALRQARGRYLLLLNPDTELPPGALAETVGYLDAHPDIGVLGPKLVRSDGSLDLACRRSFPSPEVAFYRLSGLARLFPKSRRIASYNLLHADPDEPMDVDSVSGAFMLIRHEAIVNVGLLDETYRMYGEDLDWAYRIKRAGWRVRYQPTVVVLHHKGQSSRQRPVRALVDFYHAMYVFYRKHYAPSRAAPFNALIYASILLYGCLAIARNALRRPADRPSGSVTAV